MDSKYKHCIVFVQASDGVIIGARLCKNKSEVVQALTFGCPISFFLFSLMYNETRAQIRALVLFSL